jgi:uncharacterized protein YrzB (UPF0473 family)
MALNDLNNKITIRKDDGEEEDYIILFTYHSDKFKGDFVLVYKDEQPDDVLLFQYFDDGTLDAILDEDILAEAQRVLDKYEEEIEEEDL